MPMSAPEHVAGERADLLQSLARQRHFLRYTTRGLTDEQAAQQTTASELSLGGLIKHVALTERQWMRFVVDGPSAMSWDEASTGDWMAGFRMLGGQTLAGLLENYAQVAHRTEELVAQLPDLHAAHPLPPAPWFEPGARWSARRPCRHHPRVSRRRQVNGIAPAVAAAGGHDPPAAEEYAFTRCNPSCRA